MQLQVREGQGALLETWLENGSVDLAILFRNSPTPKNGDEYLVEVATYLVGASFESQWVECGWFGGSSAGVSPAKRTLEAHRSR